MSVSVCVQVGCGSPVIRWMGKPCQKTKNAMYSMSIISSVHQETRTKPLYFTRVPKKVRRLVTILCQNGRQWWRKMEQSGMPMFQCQFVAGLYCRLFSFFYFFSFFFSLIGWGNESLYFRDFVELPGIVDLWVGVPGYRRERAEIWSEFQHVRVWVWMGTESDIIRWTCTSAPVYFVYAPPKSLNSKKPWKKKNQRVFFGMELLWGKNEWNKDGGKRFDVSMFERSQVIESMDYVCSGWGLIRRRNTH